jgi:hypothetical protein
MEEAMRAIWIKLVLFLCLWYEVSVELGLSGATAVVVTLLICGGALMLLRLPGQLLATLGPRMIVWAAPLAVWLGLAWWLVPGLFTRYPALTVTVPVGLGLLGAGAHYVVSRYPGWFGRARPVLRALLVPIIVALLGLASQVPDGLLRLCVVTLLVLMPMRYGWRFIGPVAPHKFDAKMGDARGFRGAGYRDQA